MGTRYRVVQVSCREIRLRRGKNGDTLRPSVGPRTKTIGLFTFACLFKETVTVPRSHETGGSRIFPGRLAPWDPRASGEDAVTEDARRVVSHHRPRKSPRKTRHGWVAARLSGGSAYVQAATIAADAVAPSGRGVRARSIETRAPRPIATGTIPAAAVATGGGAADPAVIPYRRDGHIQ